jgi:hypothetical protein
VANAASHEEVSTDRAGAECRAQRAPYRGGRRLLYPTSSAQGLVVCETGVGGDRGCRRTGLSSLPAGFQEGCGRWGRCCRHYAFGFSAGLGRSAGGGGAAGHGGLAASLQAFLAALPAASDLSFLLSHRGPPCRKGLRFSAVNEGPNIVPCGVAVNCSERRVWFCALRRSAGLDPMRAGA